MHLNWSSNLETDLRQTRHMTIFKVTERNSKGYTYREEE